MMTVTWERAARGEVNMNASPSLIDGDWRSRAKCTDSPHMTDQFFDESEAVRKEATKFCRNCPTRGECLAEALDAQTPFGVWGGMTERQRTRFLTLHPTPPHGFPTWTAYARRGEM